jgi:CDP-diacylglycerol--glycerol-3-phosphate 3-phosphatidyltransferase
MASIYDIKPAFQRLLRPLVARLAAAGVTANQVTLAALLVSYGVGACVALFPAARWPLGAVPVGPASGGVDGLLRDLFHGDGVPMKSGRDRSRPPLESSQDVVPRLSR